MSNKSKQDVVYEEVQDLISKISELLHGYVENGSNFSHNIRIITASRAINAFYIQWFLNLGETMKERTDLITELDKIIEAKQSKIEQQP
jgi:hypothetical protein